MADKTEPKTPIWQAQSIDEALRTFLGMLSSAGDKLTRQIAEALWTGQKPPEPEPEPCPACGRPVGDRRALAGCCSYTTGEGRFVQTVGCRSRQLEAACKVNGMMNGGWPVVVNATVSFWSDVERVIYSSQIDTINSDGTVGLARNWRDRKPSELWHTWAEAEAAMAKGGGK